MAHPRHSNNEAEGITGDPTLATPKLGEDLYRLAVKKIAEFVREFATNT